MGSEAAVRSPAALLASEMVSALRELSPEGRLEALALATAEILVKFGPEHGGGDPTSRVEAFTKRLAGVVGDGRAKKVATSPRVRGTAPAVEHLRDWLANEPPGKFRIVLEDHGDLGALLILGWGVVGRPLLIASQFYADRRSALEGLNRDILEPAGLAPIPYSKKKLEWQLPKPAKAKKQHEP